MSAISRALSFYFKAVTVYQVHSPTVYNFITEVMDMERSYYIFDQIEYLRNLYLKSDESIEFIELGAGSKKLEGNIRKVSQIAKYSLSPVKTCRMLFNTIKNYGSKNILELGSSLGISTAYISAVHSTNHVISIEGNPACAAITQHNLEQLKLYNTDIVTGSFEDHLPTAIDQLKSVDLAYLDGNHSYEATIGYFDMILPSLHSDSIIVLDDIYWSDGMLKAWEELKNHPKVTYSIDVYSLGYLFFNSQMKSKQHFAIVPPWMKIWQIGLFSKITK